MDRFAHNLHPFDARYSCLITVLRCGFSYAIDLEINFKAHRRSPGAEEHPKQQNVVGNYFRSMVRLTEPVWLVENTTLIPTLQDLGFEKERM